MARRRPSVWLLLVGGMGWGMWLAVISWTSPEGWPARALFFGSLFLAASLTGTWVTRFGLSTGGGRALLRGGLLGLLAVVLAWLQAQRILDWPLVVVAGTAFVLGELALALPRRA